METSWSLEMMEETEVSMLKEHFWMSNSVSTSVKDSIRRQAEGKILVKGKEDRATVEQALDRRTRMVLYKMLNRGVFKERNGCISTGKEANVYHATTATGEQLDVKVFKTSILVFKYLAPEYFMYGIVDEKTDVFAYGVLLLELITGRKPIDSEKTNLVLWAKPYLNKGNVKQLADRRLDGAFDADQMQRMVLTAGLCVRPSPPWRPTMSQVVQLLSGDEVDKKSEHLSRLVSKSHDFAYSDGESEEDYGFTDDYESDMQRHRALALEFE